MGIPAIETAVKELDSKQVANIILLGVVAEITGLLDREPLKTAINKGVKGQFVELNLKAIALGASLGREINSAAGQLFVCQPLSLRR